MTTSQSFTPTTPALHVFEQAGGWHWESLSHGRAGPDSSSLLSVREPSRLRTPPARTGVKR